MSRPFAAALLALMLCVASAPAVSATTPAQADDETFTADDAAGDIERIRTSLFAIAAVTGGLLVVYIWHTNPRRRMEVAVRRRAAREIADLESLDDTFVLPADLDHDEHDDSDGHGHREGDVTVEPDV